MTQTNAIFCGLPPAQPDLNKKSHGEGCPYCGGQDILYGYGLAAGGMGSYSCCETCNQFFDVKQDESDTRKK